MKKIEKMRSKRSFPGTNVFVNDADESQDQSFSALIYTTS
jgi:hypothetical protein